MNLRVNRVRLQHIEGVLDGHAGSFIAETVGDFDGGVAKWTLSIVPGSGTKDLSGIEGEGEFEAPHGSQASFEVRYHFR